VGAQTGEKTGGLAKGINFMKKQFTRQRTTWSFGLLVFWSFGPLVFWSLVSLHGEVRDANREPEKVGGDFIDGRHAAQGANANDFA
jgi:hypothetical protein